MSEKAQLLQMSLIKGKVFRRRATWEALVEFFDKSKEEIISDMKMVLSEDEMNEIISQIEKNSKI